MSGRGLGLGILPGSNPRVKPAFTCLSESIGGGGPAVSAWFSGSLGRGVKVWVFAGLLMREAGQFLCLL